MQHAMDAGPLVPLPHAWQLCSASVFRPSCGHAAARGDGLLLRRVQPLICCLPRVLLHCSDLRFVDHADFWAQVQPCTRCVASVSLWYRRAGHCRIGGSSAVVTEAAAVQPRLLIWLVRRDSAVSASPPPRPMPPQAAVQQAVHPCARAGPGCGRGGSSGGGGSSSRCSSGSTSAGGLRTV